MQLEGQIKDIMETETFGSNGFRKRNLVLTTEEQYPQHILIEFHQDKTDLLNNFAIGQNAKVSINVRGREWVNPQGETKYFNSLVGWKIEAGESSQSQEQPKTPAQAFEPGDELNEEDHDDLPF